MTPAPTTAGHPIHARESHTHRRCGGRRALVEKNLTRIRRKGEAEQCGAHRKQPKKQNK